MAIRCGNCHDYHETVAEVRDCHGVGNVMTDDYAGPSPKQRELIQSLHEQLSLAPYPDAEMDQFDRDMTRRTIDHLLYSVREAKVDGTIAVDKSRHFKAADYPTVTEGYYAVHYLGTRRTSSDVIHADPDHTIDFFQIQTPTEGRWDGYLFVKRVLGGGQGSEVRTERVARRTAETWLKVAATNPEAAKQLFGREIGRCGECGRQLTDETSRALGIGPVCRENGSY